MTSKLWWTKMTGPVGNGALGGTLARAPGATGTGAATGERSFRSMSPLRNLVRAWEMRNYEKLKTFSWREVTFIEQHPADMSILTQGAVMTPTVLIEGRWDTWSYADLMAPDTLLSMLRKDSEGHENMGDDKNEARLEHVIRPHLDSLGFKLMGKNGTEWKPEDGLTYYTWIKAEWAYLKKKVRIPDPSLFINHDQ
eukprot:5380734-Amphidinium_carterae.1